MEALASFALACNVLQVIGTGFKAVEIYKQVHEHGISVDHDGLKQRSEMTALNAESAQDEIRQQLKHYAPLTSTEVQLQNVAGKCLETAELLRQKLDKLSADSAAGHRAAVKVAIKTILRASSIEKLEQQLAEYREIMQTSILVNLSQSQAVLIRDQGDRFGELKDTLKDFIQRFAIGCTSVSALIEQDGSKTREEIATASEKTTADVTSHLKTDIESLKINDIQMRRKERLIRSLYFPEVHSRCNDIDVIHEGTFEWALEDNFKTPWDSLLEFLKNEQKLYWIEGKAGSGKSSLMKFILEDPRTLNALRKWKPAKDPLMICFFFWLAGSNQLQRNSKGLFSSLLLQILEQSNDALLFTHILQDLPKLERKASIGDWSVRELIETFSKVIKFKTSPIFILLDGLDEFEEKEGSRKLMTYVEMLAAMPNIKILAASRPDHGIKSEIQIAFNWPPQMRLQDLTEQDIRLLVRNSLQDTSNHHPTLLVNEGQMLDLADEIVEKADGVFLWVRLVLNSVLYGATRYSSFDELQKHIARCPKGMTDLYDHMWARNNPAEDIYREETALYFYMMTGFHRSSWSPLHDFPALGWSVFEMMLSRHYHIQQRIFQFHGSLSVKELNSLCQETASRIATRCAGLVEISPTQRPLGFGRRFQRLAAISLDANAENKMETAFNYMQQRVKFVHRSARDFLLDTLKGKEILSHHQPLPVEGWLGEVRIYMVALLTLYEDFSSDSRSSAELSLFLEPLGVLEFESEDDNTIEQGYHTIVYSLRRILGLGIPKLPLDYWNIDSTVSEKFGVGYLYYDIIGAAAYNGNKTYVQSFLEAAKHNSRPCKTYLSYLLQCASNHSFREDRIQWSLSRLELISFLLDQGASPNWHRNVTFERPNALRPVGRTNLTAFQLFLPSFAQHATLQNAKDYILTLKGFIDSGANLRARVGVTFSSLFFTWLLVGHKRPSLDITRFSHTTLFWEVDAAWVIRLVARYASDSGLQNLANAISVEDPKILFLSTSSGFREIDEEDSFRLVGAYEKALDSLDSSLNMTELDRPVSLLKVLMGNYLEFREKERIKELAQEQWDSHVGKILEEVLPRTREAEESEIRDYYHRCGWWLKDEEPPARVPVPTPGSSEQEQRRESSEQDMA
ncbi:MAG: hypothetical protein Q9227_006101 [Pyrenula ochraceoflavens]